MNRSRRIANLPSWSAKRPAPSIQPEGIEARDGPGTRGAGESGAVSAGKGPHWGRSGRKNSALQSRVDPPESPKYQGVCRGRDRAIGMIGSGRCDALQAGAGASGSRPSRPAARVVSGRPMNLFMSRSGSRSLGDVGRLGPLDVLVLSAWCGLAAGELEVAARVVNRAFGSTNRLYMMTRHFVWLVPLIDLVLFLGIGALLALATRRWPAAGGVVESSADHRPGHPAGAGAGRPEDLSGSVGAGRAGGRRSAWPRCWSGIRRAPGDGCCGPSRSLLGLVLLQAGWIVGGDRIKRWREAGPALASGRLAQRAADRARHRARGPPQRLRVSACHHAQPGAAGGARDPLRRGARTAPWTLASHASFFTGRWPHELGVQWLTPLRGDFPTLAEYLGARGYATAGFVANAGYCSYDTGLDRGFTHFEDYVLERLGFAPDRAAWSTPP